MDGFSGLITFSNLCTKTSFHKILRFIIEILAQQMFPRQDKLLMIA